MKIGAEDVFEAVRRGYNDLRLADGHQIIDYFTAVEDEARLGHVSNIKGILFEQLYVESLAAEGIAASLFESVNHPLVDVSVDAGSGWMLEMQLKATENAAYVISAMRETPDTIFVVTSEVAADISHYGVVDSGIQEVALSETVSENLFVDHMTPSGSLSIWGWIIGLPF